MSPSPLPLSPREDDDGLHFLFLRLQLHPASAQDVVQARDTLFKLADGRNDAPRRNAKGLRERVRFAAR